MIIEYKEYRVNVVANLDGVIHKDVEDTYISMFKIFEKSKLSLNISERVQMVIDLENIEYKLQGLFKYPKNRDYHRYWFNLDKCSCPVMDNMENFGTPYRDTDLDCIFHGEKAINHSKRLDKLKRILE